MYRIVYTAYGKDVFINDLTLAAATKALRSIVKNFYNRELGCTNGNARHYGEIYVERNGRPILQYTGEEFYQIRKGEFSLVWDWERIFTESVTKIA